MNQLTVEGLRSLIRLTIPLQKLREDAEQSIHLEYYQGNGNLFIRTFQGLRDKVLQIIDDPYVANMEFDLNDHITDREKVTQTLILSGQLLSYLQAETGTQGLSNQGRTSIQTAPYVILNTSNTDKQSKAKAIDVVRRALGKENLDEEE